MFLDHTQRHATVGRTPLDERSARRRDLYLTTHDTHNRQVSMPPVGFEPKISAGVRAVPRLCGFYPGICFTTEEKARTNLSQSLCGSLITSICRVV